MIKEDLEGRTDERAPVTPAPTERVVLVPGADARPRRSGLRASVAPWIIFFVVGVIVAIALFAWVLSGDPNGEGIPPTAEGRSSINATANDPDLDGSRTRTVNVDRGSDVLAMASNPASLARYYGAPITADGVVVNEVFGPEAFTVLSPTGQEMLVYVAPQGEPEFVAVSPGQEITFLGTLMPVRGDFGFLVGAPAVPAAQPAGAYLSAVAQTIRVITVQDA